MVFFSSKCCDFHSFIAQKQLLHCSASKNGIQTLLSILLRGFLTVFIFFHIKYDTFVVYIRRILNMFFIPRVDPR